MDFAQTRRRRRISRILLMSAFAFLAFLCKHRLLPGTPATVAQGWSIHDTIHSQYFSELAVLGFTITNIHQTSLKLPFFKALAWSMGQYCDSWFCFPAFKNDGSPKLALREEFADPGLLYAGKTWYAYGTNNIERGGTPKVNVQIAVSRDFQAWERVESMDMLPKLGAWAHKSNPKVWAPDVYQISASRYVMYYSAATKKNENIHCLGVAIADNPLGPFKAEDESWACPANEGGAIDADVFADEDGLYVIYKIDGNALGHGNAGHPGGPCGNGDPYNIHPTPIMLQEVDPSDGTTMIGKPIQILDRGDGDGPLVEAPSIIKIDGTYVLFFSSNCFNTLSYDTSYALGKSLHGPYTKAKSPIQYAPLLESKMYRKLAPQGLLAPGGLDIVRARDGNLKVAFHGFEHDQNLPSKRWMYTGTVALKGLSVIFT